MYFRDLKFEIFHYVRSLISQPLKYKCNFILTEGGGNKETFFIAYKDIFKNKTRQYICISYPSVFSIRNTLTWMCYFQTSASHMPNLFSCCNLWNKYDRNPTTYSDTKHDSVFRKIAIRDYIKRIKLVFSSSRRYPGSCSAGLFGLDIIMRWEIMIIS
jgi:hypothetical protein